MAPQPPPDPDPATLLGELRLLGCRLFRAAGHTLLVLVSIAVLALGIAMIAAPGIAALYVSVRWVLDLPGGAGRPFYPTAFGGLFAGSYLLIASIGFGSFARRLSARVARLRPTRVAEAEPGAWIALAGHVAGGRAVEPVQQEGGEPAEPCVSYPLLIQDEDGELVRVERWDGDTEPAEPPPHGWPGARFRVGAPVFAVGVLQRVDASGTYRGAVARFRLWRGTAVKEDEPLFRVRQGTQADLVSELQSDETSRWWGIASLVLLVIGAASVWLAQP